MNTIKLFNKFTATKLASYCLGFLALGLMVLLTATGASAQSGADTFTLTTTPYSGVVTQTGTFVQAMITNYGVPAILIGIAVGGWMFVKRIAKSAFH